MANVENTMHASTGTTCPPGCQGEHLGTLYHAPAPCPSAGPYLCPGGHAPVDPRYHQCADNAGMAR